MRRRRRRRRTGITVMVITGSLWLVDRFTGMISTALGKMICGDRYMRPANGMVGDMSCGFNMDMALVAFLAAAFLVGIILFVTGERIPDSPKPPSMS